MRTKTTIENREPWQPRVLVVEQQYSLGVLLSGHTDAHRQGQKQAEGRTSAEIAERLVISQRTVEMHRANLMRKLNLRTQTDLVRYAMWRGILPNEP